jgi:hypothetical protein
MKNHPTERGARSQQSAQRQQYKHRVANAKKCTYETCRDAE